MIASIFLFSGFVAGLFATSGTTILHVVEPWSSAIITAIFIHCTLSTVMPRLTQCIVPSQGRKIHTARMLFVNLGLFIGFATASLIYIFAESLPYMN